MRQPVSSRARRRTYRKTHPRRLLSLWLSSAEGNHNVLLFDVRGFRSNISGPRVLRENYLTTSIGTHDLRSLRDRHQFVRNKSIFFLSSVISTIQLCPIHTIVSVSPLIICGHQSRLGMSRAGDDLVQSCFATLTLIPERSLPLDRASISFRKLGSSYIPCGIPPMLYISIITSNHHVEEGARTCQTLLL